MVDDDPRKHGMRINGVKVLGSTTDIPKLVEHQDVGIVLFAISNIEPQERLRILSMCQNLPARTVMIPNVVEMMREEFRFGLSENKPPIQGISPAKLSNWLRQMEQLLEEENYGAVQMQIDHLRGELLSKPHE
jgi:FlaA1/EpsC-like NDP-sugar epimerase